MTAFMPYNFCKEVLYIFAHKYGLKVMKFFHIQVLSYTVPLSYSILTQLYEKYFLPLFWVRTMSRSRLMVVLCVVVQHLDMLELTVDTGKLTVIL